VLRCDPATQRKEQPHRREDKLRNLRGRVGERNAFAVRSQRAKPEAGLRQLEQWAARHRPIEKQGACIGPFSTRDR